MNYQYALYVPNSQFSFSSGYTRAYDSTVKYQSTIQALKDLNFEREVAREYGATLYLEEIRTGRRCSANLI